MAIEHVCSSLHYLCKLVLRCVSSLMSRNYSQPCMILKLWLCYLIQTFEQCTYITVFVSYATQSVIIFVTIALVYITQLYLCKTVLGSET